MLVCRDVVAEEALKIVLTGGIILKCRVNTGAVLAQKHTLASILRSLRPTATIPISRWRQGATALYWTPCRSSPSTCRRGSANAIFDETDGAVDRSRTASDGGHGLVDDEHRVGQRPLDRFGDGGHIKILLSSSIGSDHHLDMVHLSSGRWSKWGCLKGIWVGIEAVRLRARVRVEQVRSTRARRQFGQCPRRRFTLLMVVLSIWVADLLLTGRITAGYVLLLELPLLMVGAKVELRK